MRLPFPENVERGRLTTGPLASGRGKPFGCFILRRNGSDPALRILASDSSEEIPWEHVSVSTKARCPTWEEMTWVKTLFFEDEEAVMQLHPPKSQYVNCHPYCLHLWRPVLLSIPLPPMIAVGPVVEVET